MDTTFFYQLNSKQIQIQNDSNLFFPFDVSSIQTFRSTKRTESILKTSSVEVVSNSYIPVNKLNSNFYFPILILDMILLIVVAGLYRNHFFSTIRALFFSKDYQKIETKSSIIKHPLIVILFSVFILNLSLLFNVYSYRFLGISQNNLFINLSIGIFVFYVLKIASIFFSAKIFALSNVGRIYVDYLLISISYLAVFFSLVLWFDIYVGGKFIFEFTFAIIAIISLIRIFRAYSIIIPKSAFSPFHFFLYLCTVEILPLIVLGKLVMQGI